MITRRGHVVAEIRARVTAVQRDVGAHDWLDAQRASWPKIAGPTSVELLNAVYDDYKY